MCQVIASVVPQTQIDMDLVETDCPIVFVTNIACGEVKSGVRMWVSVCQVLPEACPWSIPITEKRV